MVFIMPACGRPRSVDVISLRCLMWVLLNAVVVTSLAVGAEQKKTAIKKVHVTQQEDSYLLDLEMQFAISALAKQAIHKGIPLSWVVHIEIQQRGLFWYSRIDEINLPLVVSYHALLNHYTVENKYTGKLEMFVSYHGMMDYLTHIQKLPLPISLEQGETNWRLALKIYFDREFLPVPLRPESYFKEQWDLSSDWLIWHFQN